MNDIEEQDDPFGFGKAIKEMIERGEVDELLIPDVLPEDEENIDKT
jgi:hypothetical protein